MSARDYRSYRFETEAQWDACLFAQAESSSHDGEFFLRPLPLYDPKGVLFPSQGAAAPAVTREREILWRDGNGQLLRMPAGCDESRAFAAPMAIAHADRLIATRNDLWSARRGGNSVYCFDPETLTLRFVVSLDDAKVVDIAGDGKEGIFALVQRGKDGQSLHIDCAGRQSHVVTLEGLERPIEFVYLKAARRFVVLSKGGDELAWYAEAGGARTAWIVAAALGHCFHGTHLGRNPRDQIVLGGEEEKTPPNTKVVVMDGQGVVLQDVPVDCAATGVAASHEALLIATKAGLVRHPLVQTVPAGDRETAATLITPMLRSPDTSDGRRWLRAEVTGSLPPGTTLEVSYAASSDPRVIAAMLAVANDSSLPASHRVQKLLHTSGVWRDAMKFQGGAQAPGESGAPFAVPLFEERSGNLWIAIHLIASPGAALPELTKLEVLYPGRTLMDHLPAIYRRDASQPGNFLRGLVGVLESTTQQLDVQIASMGSCIHPKTARAEWLDYLARWLGLPWDDALGLEQKRCIVRHAGEITKERGTRAGLERLLSCLVPNRPDGTRRFRVLDATADFGLATVGGRRCHGARLPAVLAGFAAPTAEIGTRLVLGCVRLPCGEADTDDDSAHLTGRIRVDVAATAEERRDWTPWLKSLITEMVPISVRVSLTWLPGDRLGAIEERTLADAPASHLGTSTVLGGARLPDRDSSLSDAGTDIGGRLH